jgi:broad specificity phosphatase PhoE
MTDQPDSSTSLVYLVRHGATANNLANPPKIQGHGCDMELSDTGRDQAARTARLLADLPLAAAYCSPLQRARETAEIICRPHRLAPVDVDALREVDVGQWEGLSWDEVRRQSPEAHHRFVTNPAEHGYAGGENLNQLRHRVQPAVERLAGTQAGGAILIVAHNVVNRVLLADLMGIPLPRAREVNQANCGVNVLRYRDGRLKVLTLNAALHLVKPVAS